MKEGYVYILFLNKSNVFYIGSSLNLEKRKARHLFELKKGTHHNKKLQKEWNVSGSDDIRLGIMAKGTEEEIRKIESAEIAKYQGDRRLMNIGLESIGGDNLSNNPEREKIIRKITIAVRKRYENMSPEDRRHFRESRCGEKNGMYGKTHSPEVRKRLSEINSGVTRRKGFKLSSSHIAQISNRQKLRTGEKNSFFGKKHTEVTKNKIREHCLKRSAKGIKPTNARKVTVDGILYSSMNDAAKATGIKTATISHRVRSKNNKFAKYQYVDD